MVLYNNSTAVTDQETDNHWLPASHIQFSQGTALLAFIAANTNVTATLTAGVKGAAQGDVMASFSSRGGPQQPLGISKPDITAPGVQILAGHSPMHVRRRGRARRRAVPGDRRHLHGEPAHRRRPQRCSGTSTRRWTPGQIKSALMTTAKTAGLVKEDGSTPIQRRSMPARAGST